MSEKSRRRRAARRVQPGDGRPLERFRWWQLSRSLFHLRQHATSKVPAAFPVEGGVIEVAASMFGLKRCHYVTPDGVEQRLVPDPGSAAGHRARLEHDHPALSRSIGSVSVVLLLAGLSAVALELVDVIGRIPPVVDAYGGFRAPVQLPLWLTITLGVAAVAGSVERGLRVRYHWLLDGAAS